MKIAFDAKRLFHNQTGLGNYSRSLVKNIRGLNEVDQIYLLAQNIEKTKCRSFMNGDYELCEGKGRFLWRLQNMVKDLGVIRPDIYHGLSNELPVGIDKLKSTKSIVTIHDLIFVRYPHFYPRVDRVLYKEKSKRACKVADHIIAVSEATKRDIVEFFEIEEGKISVIYQACDEMFYEPASEDLAATAERPYILFVSSITERKNLRVILESMSMLEQKDRPMLKVVGKGGAYENAMRALVSGLSLGSDVKFMGHLSSIDLKAEYSRALCTVYPSFYEGFGIPIVESLLCGTPVITSNRSSMPEAALGLGILVDPESPEEISAAILKQMHAPQRLSASEVQEISQKFSPVSHAEQVMRLYKKLVAASR